LTSTLPSLSLLDTRVLGVLVEKQHTVPDTYPLTLNALTSGCNQKTSRDPVMSWTEPEVQAALDRLKTLSLIVESSGGRVMRYAHNVERVVGVPSQAVALLATMMLRGPQTIGELRINSDRMHRFADGSAIEAFLHELKDRNTGALVTELSRQPGARETRWMHLLSGEPAPEPASPVTGPHTTEDATAMEIASLTEDVRRLERELAAVKQQVADLRAASGEKR
jgi:uncharacterized protein